MLQNFGWLINSIKCPLVQLQRLEYLGILFDTNIGRVFLPSKKISLLISTRHCIRVLGLMNVAVPAVPLAQWHIRHLQFAFLQQWDRSSLHQQISLPFFVKQALIWWTRLNNSGQCLPLSVSQMITISSDTSLKGWGAHCQDKVAQ